MGVKVFLGGTCNGSTWRDELIPKLTCDWFNPVVPEWTEEAYKEELLQREICDYNLYCITPKMVGVYSIAEAVDDSNKKPVKTIYLFLDQDEDKKFDEFQIKSLTRTGVMIQNNDAKWFTSLDDVAIFLNTMNNENR